MTKQNMTAWFFEGGTVGIPRRLMGLMEPLGLTFDDMGKILYLLYCGTDQVKRTDRYAMEAAQTLHRKGLVHWYTDTGTVDFSPMFDRISASLGNTGSTQPQAVVPEESMFTAGELNFSQLVKQLEQKLGLFLNLRDKQALQEVAQRYNWSYELVGMLYEEYYRNHRKQYDFGFFCQMAYGAAVQDKESMSGFLDGLNTTAYKTTEVLRRLGKRNHPTEPQKEMYLKWSGVWKFTHEMILLAVDETVGADNPNFKYIDAVLEDWKKREITTPEGLEQDRANRQKTQEIDRTINMISPKRTGSKTTAKTKIGEPRNLDFLQK